MDLELPKLPLAAHRRERLEPIQWNAWQVCRGTLTVAYSNGRLALT